MSVMRSSLLGSLLQVLRHNLDRKADRVRVFEVGRVFLRDPSVVTTDSTVRGVHQPMRVAGLAFGAVDGLDWSHRGSVGVDFFDAKGDVQALLAPRQARFEVGSHPAMHPGRCAEVYLDGVSIGFVGELHPRWRQAWALPTAPVLFELDLQAVLARELPAFHPVPKAQPVERDLAVVVQDGISHDAVMTAVRAAETGGLLQEVRLFDLYKPQQAAAGIAVGEKSLAVRLTLGDPAQTLTDEQIEGALRSVVDSLGRKVGGRLRG